MTMKHWVVSFLAVAAGAGCVFNEQLTEGEESQALKNQCDDWFCGQNSPVILNHGFSDLRIDHAENAQGFAFWKLVDAQGVEWELHVNNAEIWGKSLTGSGLLTNQHLVGSRIWVRYRGSAMYIIEISEVGPAQFWAALPNGTHPTTPSYTLRWAPFDITTGVGHFEDLCSNPPDSDNVGETLGIDVHRTVVFEGDRFDSVTKKATGYDGRYFNLGCAGSLLAKMHLSGHTTASSAWGYATTIYEKTAMIKMLSADYCGDGSAFTVAGEPLYWADDRSTMQAFGKGDVEARWSHKGALCLNKPRVLVNPTDLSKQTFGWDYDAFQAELIAACGGKDRVPPPCTDTELVAKPGHLVSVNPYLSN